jgi:hypothetical protein
MLMGAARAQAFMTGQVLQVDGGISAGVKIPSFRDFASNHRGLPPDFQGAGPEGGMSAAEIASADAATAGKEAAAGADGGHGR